MIVNPAKLRMQQDEFQKGLISRHASLTWDSSTLSPIGCCDFFDVCTDQLMSLHFQGQLPLLDWMGFNVSNVCTRTFEFLTYVRADRDGDNPTVGYLTDPCEEPNSYELGTAKLTIEDFGMYGRMGPTRKVMQAEKYCETRPVRRLDGSVVDDELEWDMRLATDVIIQDLSRDVIVGNKTSNPGQMDGLESIVKTGYPGAGMLDSIVIDWNGNPMTASTGATWNGAAMQGAWDFINVLRHVVRRIKKRISWAPMLANQQMNLGDMILVMPDHTAACLLDFYTCWSVCKSFEDVEIQMQSLEARRFRDGLEGGMFGDGVIMIEQIPIPILRYDWGLIKSQNISDIYLLTRGVGGMRMIEGEHLSAERAVDKHGNLGFFSRDGGRLLGRFDDDNQCYTLKLWMHPRMYSSAPWAQVRFQNVNCTGPVGPLSPDPEESSFYPLDHFSAAVCPPS